METIYLLILVFILFLVDILAITSVSLFIYNSIVLLKIKSIHKQNTINFLNKIKRNYDWTFRSTFVFAYVAHTLIALIVYLFLRFALFYVFQLKINLLYSLYMIYFLLIPLSFYFGFKTKIKNISGVQNTIKVGNRDIPIGDYIFGLFTFFSFRRVSKFYNFLKNTLTKLLKPILILQWIILPLFLIIFGIFYLIKTNDLINSLTILILGIVALSLFYLFKRNLKFTKFSIFLVLILLIGIIISIFKAPLDFILLIIIAIILYFINLFRYKKNQPKSKTPKNSATQSLYLLW